MTLFTPSIDCHFVCRCRRAIFADYHYYYYYLPPCRCCRCCHVFTPLPFSSVDFCLCLRAIITIDCFIIDIIITIFIIFKPSRCAFIYHYFHYYALSLLLITMIFDIIIAITPRHRFTPRRAATPRHYIYAPITPPLCAIYLRHYLRAIFFAAAPAAFTMRHHHHHVITPHRLFHRWIEAPAPARRHVSFSFFTIFTFH